MLRLLTLLLVIGILLVAGPSEGVAFAADHPACTVQLGGTNTTCFVVDADPYHAGEQADAVIPAYLGYDVDILIRVDPAVTGGLTGFYFTLNYDASWLDASVPVPGSSIPASWDCASSPPDDDVDGNPATGDAYIGCALIEAGTELAGTVRVARIHFITTSDPPPFGSLTTSLTLGDAVAFDASFAEIVSCDPVSLEPGGGCLDATWTYYGPTQPSDHDGDGVTNFLDNCEFIFNPYQENNEADAMGDICDPDDDNDTVSDSTPDNCQYIANPAQENNDRNFIDLPPTESFDDTTRANSDTPGDACDPDDDNDGLTDAAETAGAPCASATAATLPLVDDTDGDLALDGAECTTGTDPNSASSKLTLVQCGSTMDSDGDGILNYREVCYYNTDPGNANSDGDACGDGREVASINEDQQVNVIDLQQVAQSSGPSTGPNYIADFDVTKSGGIDVIDLQQVAARSGPCP